MSAAESSSKHKTGMKSTYSINSLVSYLHFSHIGYYTGDGRIKTI